jgi:hypothetical protein
MTRLGKGYGVAGERRMTKGKSRIAGAAVLLAAPPGGGTAFVQISNRQKEIRAILSAIP